MQLEMERASHRVLPRLRGIRLGEERVRG
jgi:hypothetical protein